MAECSYIGLAALKERALAAVREAVVESAEHLVSEAQAAAPVRTGTLRASIHVDSVESSAIGTTATVATGGESSDYAIFVHEGTGPHPIDARNAQALAWPGAAHPVKSVQHPGTRATKFLERPLVANRPLYLEAMARAARGEF